MWWRDGEEDIITLFIYYFFLLFFFSTDLIPYTSHSISIYSLPLVFIPVPVHYSLYLIITVRVIHNHSTGGSGCFVLLHVVVITILILENKKWRTGLS